MGSVTAKTVQPLSTPMGAKNITSTERSGTMELRSWRDRRQQRRAAEGSQSKRRKVRKTDHGLLVVNAGVGHAFAFLIRIRSGT
jgi:hypothetical protein